MNKIITLLFALVLFHPQIIAQQTETLLDQPITLQDAITIALDKEPRHFDREAYCRNCRK